MSIIDELERWQDCAQGEHRWGSARDAWKRCKVCGCVASPEQCIPEFWDAP